MVMPKIYGRDAKGRPLDKKGKVIQRLAPRGPRPKAKEEDPAVQEAAADAEAHRQAHEQKTQEAYERMQRKTGPGMGLGPHKRKPRKRPVVEELKEIKELLSNQ